MIELKKKLTLYNFEKMSSKVNRYIVVHYVGGESSAKNNADYFYNNKLSSSAHYFVDENEIWQVVDIIAVIVLIIPLIKKYLKK